MASRTPATSTGCPARDVAKHNTVTQALAVCFGLVVGACASAGANPDAGYSPSPDAPLSPTPDAASAVDARLTPDATITADGALPPDAPTSVDAGASADAGISDAAPPVAYSHTIAIDGTNDFDTTADMFATTSAGYTAYVSWDATYVYLGYDGADIGSADTQKWLLVFFDTDPGAASGAATGEQYNTQRPGMPSGFGAEFYFRWRASNDFQDLQQYVTSSWQPVTTTLTTHQSGTYVEIAIPRAALGNPATVGITALMVNEAANNEWSYAGLYSSNFTDGYYDAAAANVPLANYLLADFSSAAAPNAATNLRP